MSRRKRVCPSVNLSILDVLRQLIRIPLISTPKVDPADFPSSAAMEDSDSSDEEILIRPQKRQRSVETAQSEVGPAHSSSPLRIPTLPMLCLLPLSSVQSYGEKQAATDLRDRFGKVMDEAVLYQFLSTHAPFWQRFREVSRFRVPGGLLQGKIHFVTNQDIAGR